jgi:hypothetical protein
MNQAGTPVSSSVIKRDAEAAGHAEHNIKRAGKKLGVKYTEADLPERRCGHCEHSENISLGELFLF